MAQVSEEAQQQRELRATIIGLDFVSSHSTNIDFEEGYWIAPTGLRPSLATADTDDELVQDLLPNLDINRLALLAWSTLRIVCYYANGFLRIELMQIGQLCKLRYVPKMQSDFKVENMPMYHAGIVNTYQI